MSKEKQIEGMAREVMGGCDECSKCPLSFDCKAHEYATKFYNAGFRKQSEGEWIRKDGFLVCSKCDATKPIAFSTAIKLTYYKCDFCPKCGAKMKGGE